MEVLYGDNTLARLGDAHGSATLHSLSNGGWIMGRTPGMTQRERKKWQREHPKLALAVHQLLSLRDDLLKTQSEGVYLDHDLMNRDVLEIDETLAGVGRKDLVNDTAGA